MKKSVIYLVGLLFVLFLIPLSSALGDNFSGVGDTTTATFESTLYTKIDWTYTPENEYDLLMVDVIKQGESFRTISFDDATSGTTYLYESGTFYFDVAVANVLSWEITTTPTNGEWASPTETFTGKGNRNTKLFKSYGDTEITWTATAENEYDLFMVDIMELGKTWRTADFDELTGTTYLYESGDFYFDVAAANIASWSITIDVQGGDTSEPTGNGETTESSEGNGKQTEDTPGYSVLGILIVLPTLVLYYKRKKSDRRT